MRVLPWCAAALAATVALGPASAAASPATVPRSHLWTVGSSTVLGWRVQPQPIHGLPAGQHVTGVAYTASADVLLGNGTVWTVTSSLPVQAAGLTGITSLSAAGATLYAVSGTGAVYSWAGSGSASPVTGVSHVTSVDNGYALEADGSVWALGGTTPVRVDVPGAVKQISSNACGAASYALTASGRIFAWGSNTYGQLGDGTRTDSPTPVLVHRVRGAADVVGGCYDAYAILKGTGTLMAWGKGDQGEMGDGHRATRLWPVAVSDLTGITSVTTSVFTTYAVRSDGTVWAWGFGLSGQLGNGTRGANSSLPVQVTGFTSPIATVAATQSELYIPYNHLWIYLELNYAVALGRDGSVWTWGSRAALTASRMPRVPAVTGTWVRPDGGVIYLGV